MCMCKFRFGKVDCEFCFSQFFKEILDNFQMIFLGVIINDNIINVSFVIIKIGNNIVNKLLECGW